MIPFSIFFIIFLGVLSQSMAGFGLALIMMPVLSVLLGVEAAAPLVAVIALIAEGFLLIYFRHALNFQAVWRLSLGTIIGVPIGVWGLKQIDGRILLTILGMLLILYGLYALLQFRLPALPQTIWAYLFGLASGLLGGAYNTSGPPYIIYGNCRGWDQAQFKSNLQAVFVINVTMAIVSHGLSGNFTPFVWQNILFALPAIILGLWLGLRLDKRINPQTFRQIVLVLLIVLGLRLIF